MQGIEFVWQQFPGFSSFSILREIQKDLARENIQPEEVEDGIIFMSMFKTTFCGKQMMKSCLSNAEKVKNCAKKFLPRHWTLLGPGSEKEMVCRNTINKDSGIAQPTKWYSDSKKLVIIS